MTQDKNYLLAQCFQNYFLYLLYKSKISNQSVFFDNSSNIIESLDSSKIEINFVHNTISLNDNHYCIVTFENKIENFKIQFNKSDLTHYLFID
jgi:hypothetical protein